jgi:hypothetical protein
MSSINYLAVLAAAVAAFIVGGFWYSPMLFGKAYLALRGLDPVAASQSGTSVGEVVAEFVRWLVISFVLARFVAQSSVADLSDGLRFALWMWLAIYTALAGSVLHEGTPWRLFAIHAGDGLVKVVLIVTILVLWRAKV